MIIFFMVVDQHFEQWLHQSVSLSFALYVQAVGHDLRMSSFDLLLACLWNTSVWVADSVAMRFQSLNA